MSATDKKKLDGLGTTAGEPQRLYYGGNEAQLLLTYDENDGYSRLVFSDEFQNESVSLSIPELQKIKEKALGGANTISGAVTFNSYIQTYSFSDVSRTWNVNFTHDGNTYTNISFTDLDEISFEQNLVYSDSTWYVIDAPNPVIYIEEGQTLDPEFVQWLNENSTGGSTTTSGWVTCPEAEVADNEYISVNLADLPEDCDTFLLRLGDSNSGKWYTFTISTDLTSSMDGFCTSPVRFNDTWFWLDGYRLDDTLDCRCLINIPQGEDPEMYKFTAAVQYKPL